MSRASALPWACCLYDRPRPIGTRTSHVKTKASRCMPSGAVAQTAEPARRRWMRQTQRPCETCGPPAPQRFPAVEFPPASRDLRPVRGAGPAAPAAIPPCACAGAPAGGRPTNHQGAPNDVLHTLAVLSKLPVTIRFPSGEKATDQTPPAFPLRHPRQVKSLS